MIDVQTSGLENEGEQLMLWKTFARTDLASFTFALLVLFVVEPTWGEQPLPLVSIAESGPSTQQTALNVLPDTSGTDALVRSILLQNLPREYENSKEWGQTKRRWNGLDVSLDGLRIDTKRRWKEVNHGTWTRYRAWLIDPENSLQIHLNSAYRSANQPAAFDLIVDARIGATGRLSEWNRGLQLYSFSADAEGKIRLQVSCEMALQFDTTRVPPDLLLAPKVTDAKLDLLEFRLHRISEADGPVVHKLGDSLQDELNREIQERRTKLVEKLNRAIDKNRDHLRLSVHDLVASGWGKMLPK